MSSNQLVGSFEVGASGFGAQRPDGSLCPACRSAAGAWGVEAALALDAQRLIGQSRIAHAETVIQNGRKRPSCELVPC